MAEAVTGYASKSAFGTQPLIPRVASSLPDIMNTPWWDRPTVDNPDGGSGGGVDDPSQDGTPGWDGTGPDYDEGAGSGWNGIGYAVWVAGDPDDPWDGGTVDLPPTSVNIRADRKHVYRIEVYDSDGDRLAMVEDWVTGKLRLELDEASRLEFRVPGTSDNAALLKRPNTVWLRDRWGFLIETFRVMQRDRIREGDAVWFDVFCQTEIVQLKAEALTEYDQPDDETTVEAHLAALLDLQVRDNPILLGEIDDAIAETAFALHLEDTTIFGALLSIQQILPKAIAGHFYLTAARKLNWVTTFQRGPERVIALGGQLAGVRERTDWDDQVNRIWMYGEGQDRFTRLKLTDAGEAEEYIENADSVSTYGVEGRIKIDRRIKKPETLVRVAQRILDEFAEPVVEVTIDAIDLSKSDEYAGSYPDLMIAQGYRAVDPDLGIDTEVDLLAMDIDLHAPLPVRVELSNTTRRLGTFTSDIIRALTQPLDVLGDRYPNMGRNLSDGAEPDTLRAGDTRWNGSPGGGSDPRAEMHDGEEWQEIGGGGGWEKADSYPELPDPSGFDETTMARIVGDGDPQKGQIYKINAAGDTWEAVAETYEENTVGELANNAYVQKFAVGRVGAIYYRRNSDNDGWEALNELEL